jgi:hypothetical protein
MWGADFGLEAALPPEAATTEILAENVEQPKTPEIAEETQVEPSENPEIAQFQWHRDFPHHGAEFLRKNPSR